MKSISISLISFLILAPSLRSQDLPVDVLLLSRVRRQVQEELQHLPNVGCLETVRRKHQAPNGKMQPLDTVQLEVLTDGRKELYASPGDRNFSDRPPIAWVGSGTLGDGIFGLYLGTVLANRYASYRWKGEEEIAGQRLARWDYQIALMWAGQTFDLYDGSGNVSLHGSFWADPQTGNVVRLSVAAGDFPPSLPLSEAEWSIDYSPTVLNSDSIVLLPQSADFRMVRLSGETSDDQFAFTQCHSFGAQSTIRFDAPELPDETPRFGAATIDDTLRPLPPGLRIPVKLKTRIGDGTSVGALIDGVVAGNVSLKGVVVIAAGSPVRGRIRRLERYSEPFPYFVVAIEYTEVSSQGIRYRFEANLNRIAPTAGVAETLSVPHDIEIGMGPLRSAVVHRETISFSGLPGVATFFFTGVRLNLPSGFETVWNTRTAANSRDAAAASSR